jgi:RimJ/RimL family protein N-acetyltransferase
MNLQPTNLETEIVKLIPLKETDFEALFAVASDPLIWEQHPSNDRYKRDVFQSFFNDGMASKGAFIIVDKLTNEVIGSSRYYLYDPENSSLSIGYTFFARKYWGTNYNKTVKSLMINHAFLSLNKVLFHVGEFNIRSQKAVGNIGGKLVEGKRMAMSAAQPDKISFEYIITKKDWKGIAL